MYLCKYVPNIFRKSKHSLELCVTYNPGRPPIPFPWPFSFSGQIHILVLHLANEKAAAPDPVYTIQICLFIY